MIQDIAPHRYDNTYRDLKPEASDYALCIMQNKTLLLCGEETQAAIPCFSQILPVFPEAFSKAVYLFSIDEKPYFLVEPSEEEAPVLADSSAAPGLSWKGTQYFRTMEPAYQSFAAITATQLWRWRQSRRFCGRCAAAMTESRTERALVCPSCGQTEYPKISPAVIVAITDGDRLLMSRYRDRPYRGYALIAGFVEIGESFEETVRREVMEEVGLKVKNIRYFKSQPWAFTDTEMIGFFAELDGDDTIRLQEDELSEAGWYTREEIPDDDVMISVGSEMKMAFKYKTWDPDAS
ncbi:NAD(+) diphosphatase [Clostridiaceae bacterium]|jgi:NAD+ diphosphatase|nr:NAD(+) diphosphatase [Clostridium sp.]NBI71435.1 NAD(+) diphosphatase [Clostridiaceae bacterium]